ncbi:MAG: DUF6377 domain-containing protein [Prevotellaceae bacterium]|jgi:DNA-binding CsgD family transcriptional regulator/uncharacterized protein YoxC|nr:DUF6377 domain-containing protein [Prevotellaceae bacterium]
MKKVFALAVLFTVATGSFARAGRDTLFAQLNEAIKNKSYYDRQKEQQLAETKHLLNIQSILPVQAYDFNREIAVQYSKYIIDSAIYYTKQSLDIAAAMNRHDWVAEAGLHLAHLYTTAGMYIEANNILLAIDRRSLPGTLLPLYFETYSDFYGYYGQSNNQAMNIRLNIAYRDSLLSVLDTASLPYKIHNAVKLVHSPHAAIAEQRLLEIFRQLPEGNADYALVSYLLGLVYIRQHDVEQLRKYFTLSAIADIRNATKDHAALQSLAMSFYESGDVERAYTCMKSVMDDIDFGQIRFRVIELASLYSAVNTAYLTKTMQQKREMQRYFILISVLLFFLIISVFYVYRQMRKVSKIKKELSETNLKLTELNQNISHANEKLHKMNVRLSEANRIKEEYIAQFFDICSGYIDKLESYRKMLHKKAAGNQHEELFKTLKSTTLVDEERKKLYETFDTVFLNLYPSFVEDFNSLLINEEKVALKQGERLNTELRIFALIRLGITDSMKIAGFLRYSLSTIYNYRTRARNNTVVSRDEFEEMVMGIGNIHTKR